MSRKYVIEIDNKPYMKAGKSLYKAKKFKSLVFDDYGIEQLEPYDKAEIQKEVWDFVAELYNELPNDSFCGGAWVEDIVRCNSYGEAKQKFEQYKRNKSKDREKTILAIIDTMSAAGVSVKDLYSHVTGTM